MESLEPVEDLFLVIVGDGTGDHNRRKQVIQVKEEVVDDYEESSQVTSESVTNMNLLETAKKHGQLIPLDKIKQEDLGTEYLEAEFIGGDSDEDYILPNDNEEEYSEEEPETEVKHSPSAANREVHRYTMRQPEEQQSFVKELCEQYPELATDKELLIDTLCELMIQKKPPDPPQDYFIMNDINYECVTCGAIKDSLPAMGRHWQEKHGPRYLVCYACGVDFRSKTNLYKHEKRCKASDAVVVLQARARFVGRKGRSRPFLLPPNMLALRQKMKKERFLLRYRCEQCPAEYATKQSLQSHQYAHQGARPYQCSLCTHAYTSYTALNRHRHSKHGQQKFICDTCERPFTSKSALVQHLNTHRPTRRFSCEICGKRFAQKLALQLHMDRVHYNLPPPCACQICPKRYPRMSLLKAHMLREHGMNLITRNMFYKALPNMSDTQLQQARIVMKSDNNSQQRQMYRFQDSFLNESKTTSEPNKESDMAEENLQMEHEMPQVEYKIEDKQQTETASHDEYTPEMPNEEYVATDLSEELTEYVKKFQEGKIYDNTKMIIIQDGQVLCIDDSNKHLYKEHLHYLENEDFEVDDKELTQQQIQLQQGDSDSNRETGPVKVDMTRKRKVQKKGARLRKGLS